MMPDVVKRAWLVECENEADEDNEVISAWKASHPGFIEGTWDWYTDNVVKKGLLVADNSGGADFGCPEDNTVLVATKEAAEGLGARDPAVASGARPIKEISYIRVSVKDDDARDVLDQFDAPGLVIFYVGMDTRVVALPASAKNETLLAKLVVDIVRPAG
jgi:hypothetical protein